MEVTRKNFKETLPLVADSISKADFLVIDAEFTGLINGRDVSIFDSPQEYYEAVLNGSAEFLLIQYGVCAFYWDEEKQHYMNDAYNFYLFPRSIRPGSDKMFLCQSSSLDFLASQGFDFNKLFREGISYMTEKLETHLRNSLTERQKLYNNTHDIVCIPKENKQQIEDICTRVREFLDAKESDELEIDRCNSFIRRLLFQELGARFKDEAFFETKILDNKDRVLKVTRITSECDGKNREQQKKDKEWEDLEDAVGFSKVARMISQSGKLVIGHNMLLDLLHTLNHFFQPLPVHYESFKEFAHCMFPRILDTKYMSSMPPFKDHVNSSVLQHLYATLAEPPFSLPKVESLEGRGYNRLIDKHHEAGYDAYITGLCFLAMHAHLAETRGEPSARVVASHAAIQPFLNKLFLAKTAHQDSPYMNLSGDDPTPSRDHVFHLKFPKEFQRNDINQLFSPFGPITVQFLDECSALIALGRREQARLVSRALKGHARVRLMPYAHYKYPDEAPKEPADRGFTWIPNASSESPKRPAATSPLPEKIARPRTNSASRTDAYHVTHQDQTPSIPEKVARPRTASGSRPAAPTLTPSSPEVSRPRANSASTPAPAPSRKRTSSGVFQIDDAEPPQKKVEIQTIETRKKLEAVKNGANKTKKETTKVKELKKKKEKKTTDRFDDGDAKSKCVSAFKESDCWE